MEDEEEESLGNPFHRSVAVETAGALELPDKVLDASLQAVRGALRDQMCEGMHEFAFKGLLSMRGVDFVVDYVMQPRAITHLALTDGVLDEKRTQSLCKGLKVYGKHLLALDVSRNDCGDANFEMILASMRFAYLVGETDPLYSVHSHTSIKHAKLRRLAAANNSLSNESLVVLACWAEEFCHLEDLDISENPRVNDEVAHNVNVRFLKREPVRLKSINISKCSLTAKGAELLQERLRSNVLTKLVL